MPVDLSDYVDVAARIRQFKESYPEGTLQPVDPLEPYTVKVLGDKAFVVYTAAAYRNADDKRPGIGIAWEPFPGKTPYTRDSELMNAETSAWGRAIVALGIPTQKVASADEVMNRAGAGTPAPMSNAERVMQKAPAADAEPVLNEAGDIVGWSGGSAGAAPRDNHGEPAERTQDSSPMIPLSTGAQQRKIHVTLTEKGIEDDAYREMLGDYGVVSSKELTKKQASEFIDKLLAA